MNSIATAGRTQRLLLPTAAILLIVLAFELTVRIEDWVRFRMPIISPYRGLDDLIVRDADGAHGRPNAHFRKWVMNSLGTRGPEASPRTPSGRSRVVVVGASETFGLYESPNKEFPRQLEQQLRRGDDHSACGSVPRPVEVLNAAHAGMSTPTIIQDIETRLARLAPDVVVYYPSPAQYLENDPPTATLPDATAGNRPLPLRNALHPRSGRRAWEQVKAVLPAALETLVRNAWRRASLRGNPSSSEFDGLPRERLVLYEEDLRRLVRAIRAIGARPVLMTHANAFPDGPVHDHRRLAGWASAYPRATGSTLLAFDAAAAEATRRVAVESQAALVDVRANMNGRTELFVDFTHFTDDGAATVAAMLVGAIRPLICGTTKDAPASSPPVRTR